MSNFVSKEVQIIYGAIKQAFEMEPNPGNSVNATDNPSQVGLIGRFNLHNAAGKVWEQLKAHFESEKAAIEKAIAEAEVKVKADAAKAATDVKADVTKVDKKAEGLV